MCGRYAATKDPGGLAEEFEASMVPEETLLPDYNVAPTKKVYVVIDHQDHHRSLDIARWGLVPVWAKDPSIGSRMINARAETVSEKPAFRRAFAKRRCLVPAAGYYEWYTPTGENLPLGTSGKPRKQPFFIRPADGASLPMAGLYEWWRDPTVEDPEGWRLTCTVLTTAASEAVARIHDRMPLTVPHAEWGAWLDPDHEFDLDMILGDAIALEAFPVSTTVNSVRNNGPELIVPLESG